MDYTQFIGPVLVVFGAALQWLRQFSAVKDRYSGLVALIFGSIGYALAHKFGPDWRYETLIAVPLVAGYTATVLGGTFVTASAAMNGVAVIPKTNSK